jgi:inorganic phosphate transporter, PiT family
MLCGRSADVTMVLTLTVVTIAVALVFDYTNGFHDAANIIATVIASRAMTPAQAVLVVGLFEFLGPLLGGTAVANTIGTFVELDDLNSAAAITVVLCALLGAISWNLFTWWRGIPSSSSHALVGGLIGAVVVSTGVSHVMWGFGILLEEGRISGVTKILLALALSPLLGFGVAFVVHKLNARLLAAARPSVNRKLRLCQWATAAGLAFSHGANDGQKSMGILTLILLLGGYAESFRVPFWVTLVCSIAITLGVLSGGWRIVRTLGFAIYKVRPLHALDSQLTSAGVVLFASMLGAPTSTSQVVATSIMGIGFAERPKAVRWEKAREIGLTWVVTLPGAAALASVFYALTRIANAVSD